VFAETGIERVAGLDVLVHTFGDKELGYTWTRSESFDNKSCTGVSPDASCNDVRD